MLKGAEEGVGGAGEVRVTFIPGAPFSDVVWNGKPWTTEGGGWKLHSWATDLSGAHKPSGAPKDQGKGFGFMEIQSEIISRLCKVDAKQTELHLARGSSERPLQAH